MATPPDDAAGSIHEDCYVRSSSVGVHKKSPPPIQKEELSSMRVCSGESDDMFTMFRWSSNHTLGSTKKKESTPVASSVPDNTIVNGGGSGRTVLPSRTVSSESDDMFTMFQWASPISNRQESVRQLWKEPLQKQQEQVRKDEPTARGA